MTHLTVFPRLDSSFEKSSQNKYTKLEILPNKQSTVSREDTFTPPTSKSNSKEFNIEKFEQEILERYKAKLQRVTNIYLTSKWKSMKPLERFRNLAKAVIVSNRWRETTELKDEDDSCKQKKQPLRFNVDNYRIRTSGNAVLSVKAKLALMKDPYERTHEDVEHLFGLAQQMKCFNKYPYTLKKELGALLYLETFEDGRLILKEGTPGISMYYIVNGGADIEICHVDRRTGEKRHFVVGELNAGSTFGELALVHDCVRTASVVCKGRSQFLRMDRDDFELAVERSHEREWLDKLQMVKSVPYFSNWSSKDLRYIILNCCIEYYNPGSVILGDTNAVTENIYFVHSGVCTIIRQVRITEATEKMSKHQIMVALSSHLNYQGSKSCVEKRSSKLRFLNIGQLFPGDYFGVGEPLLNYYILSKTPVECLIVPRHAVSALERILDSTGNVLDKKCCLEDMKKHAESRLLSLDEVLDKWITNLNWKNFKRKTVQGPNNRASEKIRKRNLAPMRMKDFRVPETLPCISERPIDRRNSVYLMSRKGGFLNVPFDELRQPVSTSSSSFSSNTRDSEKLENVCISRSGIEEFGRNVTRKRSKGQLHRLAKD